MRWLLILSFALFGQISFCQIGFNKAYDFGQLAAGFGSLELSGDTIIIYGTALEEGQPAFGLLFARIDTLGILIDYAVLNDSLNRDFTQVYPNSLIKFANETGYVGIGQYFSKHGYISMFDNNGSLIYLKEFPDLSSVVDFYKEIKELADGFLILGDKADATNGVLNIFVMKTDFEGNKIWEKKFTAPGRQTLFGNVLILDENEYVIGATTTTVQGVPLPQVKNTSKIFAIDSLGNVKWQWESPPSLEEEAGVGRIFKTPEGNWAYMSGRGWYNAIYNEISQQPKFIIRDENFILIKEDTFGVADNPVNGFYNTIQLNDGGWLAVGVKPVHYPLPPVPMWYNSFSGWMVRLDSQGDQLWSRVDTAFWSVESGSTNYLYDAVELPSGSIIACGYSRTYEPEPKDWGWLIKVSKDGCIDTLNCTPLNTNNDILFKNKINIYPNPTQSIINIESTGIDVWDNIEVINVTGQTMKVLNNTHEKRIDLSGLEDGIYFVKLIQSNQSVTRKIIKRR